MRILLISILGLLTLASCTKQEPMEALIDRVFTVAEQQYTAMDTRLTEKTLPRTLSADGEFVPSNIYWWCSGFYPGSLWYIYEYTRKDAVKTLAEKNTLKLDSIQYVTRDHDVGFQLNCSYGNAFRLTGNEAYKQVLYQGAKSLSTRFNPAAGVIRSWDFVRKGCDWKFPVIIDNMMNLELLYWAFKETGDSVYYNIANTHARTTIKNHFRDNYSSYHVIDYDTITGDVLHKHTHQGYNHESAWSRGQAWGLYGYTMCYRETKLPEFLSQAEHIANYIFTNPTMPEDMVTYWDFDAPGIPNEPKDASAAAVMACAMYELSMYNPEKAALYKKWADTIVESLSKNYRAQLDGDRGFLLLHSTGAHNFERDVPLVYADYYFLEALLKKAKLEKEGTAIL